MSPDGRSENPDKPATARVFFGLWPTPEQAALLANIGNEAALRFGGKPTRLETVHLTLAFLGDVPVTRLPELCDVAASLQFQPFELSIDQLGCWAHKHLLWAGCRNAPPGLLALVINLREALAAAGFSVAGRGHGFTPHVTLVRKLPLVVFSDSFQKLPCVAPLRWQCASFDLIGSKLSSDGSAYRVIASFP
ncbi:MAG: RNA 2',3'-cyclic phosphodiesterase [Azonexus sp.]|nr:RNA 2',3'-cyclic phosphodiesterase [Azonexus sp.]